MQAAVYVLNTLGTKMRAKERKQQKTIAVVTKAKLASACDEMTRLTGAVIKHNTTTLYIDMPT